ncbi:phage tail tape measure protein [Methylobacterium brachythecii]|uniref:Lambda family phage tail tape measure protein n=1 Tax=Methylobacterium brachythecii TaxID=1176177 RepID=A0A7W6F4Y1_9HYPH|nr:phage tail tape measure protein [Methylobacterium brachythecii]MBB3900753.1 lambda family phage tail tape measure protein [Methylobacterium brachythecii]GLS46612.1 hypothetical protein GCM10007884_46060 [Methylobacterium brachythecii]
MADTDPDRANADRAKQLETLDQLSKKFGQSLSSALTTNLNAGRQLDGVLGTLATKLSSIALKAALTPVTKGLASLVKGLLGNAVDAGTSAFAKGGVIAAGRVRPFASGGIVAAPTYFPMQGGTGLMGEAGPEAILPLQRGSDGRLGVASAGERPVSVSISIATPDAESFRRSEAQVAASLARAVARGRRAL